MTEEEMLKELESWDEEAWKEFKRRNYEVIEIGEINDSSAKRDIFGN